MERPASVQALRQPLIKISACLPLLAGMLVPLSAQAHTTASELAELSLQELMDVPLDEETNGSTENSNPARWQLALTATYRELSGYQSGTNKLSNEEVLFRRGEQRTDQNYPVLPTEITQEVLTFRASYMLSDKDSIAISIPYVRQSTDHISIIPNYPQFLITSEGLGDIDLLWRRSLLKTKAGATIAGSLGMSLPTGSIDETGDTPRAPGNQQLPYTMQLGSGTNDLQIALRSRIPVNEWDMLLDAGARFRLGNNGRGYRLGNKYGAAISMQRPVSELWSVRGILAYENSGDIRGRDEEITVPGPFPYPANITAPENFGGSRVFAGAEAALRVAGIHTVSAIVGRDVHQDLNGVQIRAKWRAGLTWSCSF